MRGKLADEVARLKAEPGGYLLAHGGAGFAQALSRERLVDEYRLVVQPAALGDGLVRRARARAAPGAHGTSAHTYPTGAAIHVYRPRYSG